MDRDCTNCTKHTDNGCTSWKCEFEPRGDLISRQAVIYAIVNTPTDVYSHDSMITVLDGAAFRQDEIIDIINALPSAEPDKDMIHLQREQAYMQGWEDAKPRWISCSEMLPMNDDWVVVTILDERGDTPYLYSDFGWYLDKANCWIVDAEQRTDVIAWMPLPEPWKGD